MEGIRPRSQGERFANTKVEEGDKIHTFSHPADLVEATAKLGLSYSDRVSASMGKGRKEEIKGFFCFCGRAGICTER